jgi:2-dehydro-3-deoxy-L-rhamnonate dehydrogenase (NAD+)
MNKIDLKDKVAVVTGGGQGFGLAIVNRLLDSGSEVIIWDMDEKLLNNLNLDGKLHKIVTDVIDYQSVEKATNESISISGKIDILINNAGIAGPSYKTWDYPLKEWQQVIDIDLNGVFHCCKSVVPSMIANNYGRIVNIASIAGKEGNPNAMPYSAAKAGVIALTKSLGKELADKNIAVNCVTPAAAKTRIFDQISEEHINYMLSKIPRNRFAKVDELASMVAWMASEENSFTTGAVFDLSGGRATY